MLQKESEIYFCYSGTFPGKISLPLKEMSQMHTILEHLNEKFDFVQCNCVKPFDSGFNPHNKFVRNM